ncbi:MAG: DUF308 domain-containing protein [Minisyncoccia bacterium]
METKNNLLSKASSFTLWRGLFLILFGLVAFFWAGLALWTLVITFGFFALIDGIILIIMYAKHRLVWGSASLTLGIISILIGLYTLLFPGLTAIVLALFFAMYALAGGILEIKMATHLRKHVNNEILLILNGILSILFALILLVILFFQPIFGLLILVEVMGLYAICLGIVFIILSSRLKKYA